MNRALRCLTLAVLLLATWTVATAQVAGAPPPASAVTAATSDPKAIKPVKDGGGQVETKVAPEQKPVLAGVAASAADNGAPDSDFWVKGRSREGGADHEVSLGDYVIVKLIHPLSDFAKTDKVGPKIGLYINDLYFKDLPAMSVTGREDAAMFHLVRTDINRDAWSVLFAKKTFNPKHLARCSEDPNNVIRLAVGTEEGKQVSPSVEACLEYFPNGWSAGLLLTGAFALIAATLILAFTTSMLRDPGFTASGKKTTWSLARFQMALWFVTVVCGVLFTYAVTGDIAPLPDGVLILMGIGAGTAVSAFAMDSTHIPGSKADYDAAKAAQTGFDQAVVAAQAKVAAAVMAAPPDPTLPALQQALATTKKAADDNTAKTASFLTPATRNFIFDVLSDGNGIAFHRLQVFAWTVTYWVMFVAALWHKITLIDFGTTQLALMGISGATYLGFKLSEVPKQPGTGPEN